MTDHNDPVVRAFRAYAAAVYAKDADAFVSLYDRDIHVFDMWDTWTSHGIQAWRAMAEEWFGSLGSERVTVEVDEVRSTVTAALAFGSAIVKYTAVDAAGATLRSLSNRFTIVLAPREGGWKIVHEHTSGPADPQTLKISLQRP